MNTNDPKKTDTPWLSSKEAAARLRISERTLIRYRKAGKFPYYPLSRTNFIYHTDDLDLYVKDRLRWRRTD